MTRTSMLPASVRRLTWSIMDQVVYGASNILLVSQFARSTSGAELATVSMAYAVVTIAIAVTRGGLSEVLLSTNRTYAELDKTNASARVSLLLILSPIGALGGLLIFFDYSAPAILVAGIPILLVQDRFRFEWIQAGQTFGALRLDTTWLAAQLLLLTATGTALSPPSELAALCWLGGCASSLIFAKRIHVRYKLSDARTWFRDNRSPVLLTVGQVAAVMVSAQVPVFVFSLTSNANAAAGYLAAAQALSPQTAMLVALRPLVLRSIALQRKTLTNNVVARAFLAQVVPLLAVGLAIGWVLLTAFGPQLYGESVSEAALDIVWWLACTRALGALSLVFVGLLRAGGQWRTVFTGEVLTSVILGGFPIFANQFIAQVGAVAAAQAIGALISVLLWWVLTRRKSTEPRLGDIGEKSCG